MNVTCMENLRYHNRKCTYAKIFGRLCWMSWSAGAENCRYNGLSSSHVALVLFWGGDFVLIGIRRLLFLEKLQAFSWRRQSLKETMNEVLHACGTLLCLLACKWGKLRNMGLVREINICVCVCVCVEHASVKRQRNMKFRRILKKVWA